jgi:hypothetical protein
VNGALVVSTISLVIAAGALAWSVRQGVAARDAAGREDARRVAEVGLLSEQVGVLRQLMQTQEHARPNQSETRRVIITARPGRESGSSHGIERVFSIRNVGTETALDLAVWLALDSGGEPAAVASSTEASVGSVMPGDPEQEAVVNQLAPFHGGKVPRDGYLVGRWSEPDGSEHSRRLCPTVVYV